MPTLLTIAGFDPSSGAGVTADLMVFAAHGLFATSAVTAWTVQSTLGVRSTHPVETSTLRETLACLHFDLPPAGMKIGMLATAANVAVVCDYLEAVRAEGGTLPVVLDPVVRSSSDRELLDPAGLHLLRTRLLPLVTWVTPNVAELALLTGQPVSQLQDLAPAAFALQRQVGPQLGVFAKGGHLTPPDDLLLPQDADPIWLAGRHISTRATHGTGCALSSAFLARLVLGDTPSAAAHAAKHYVSRALATAGPVGQGNGPMNLLWPLRQPDAV